MSTTRSKLQLCGNRVGDHDPVVLYFATSKIAGGWIYAAQSAQAQYSIDSPANQQGRSRTRHSKMHLIFSTHPY
jgi:hypothetical protein